MVQNYMEPMIFIFFSFFVLSYLQCLFFFFFYVWMILWKGELGGIATAVIVMIRVKTWSM